MICTEEVNAKLQQKKKAVTVDSKKPADRDAAGRKAETKNVGEVKVKQTTKQATTTQLTPSTAAAAAASDTSQVTMFSDTGSGLPLVLEFLKKFDCP